MRFAACALVALGLIAAVDAATGGRSTGAGAWDDVAIPEGAVVLDSAIEGGIVWLSTRNHGLIGYDGGSWVLHLVEDGGIRTNSYNYELLVDGAGDKWIGRDSEDRPVDRLDDAGTFSDKTDDTWLYYSYPEELAIWRVLSMTEDLDGNIWFGMRNEGGKDAGTVDLLIDEGDTAVWHHYDKDQDSTAFVDDDVRALAVDLTGRLWIGYYARGVDVWDYGDPSVFADDSWDHYEQYAGLPNNSVIELHVSNDGRVWIGTESGLAVYDPSTDSTEEVEGFSETAINAMDSDARGHVWIGTDEGVTMLYRSGGVAFSYTEEDGIADAVVSEIVVDRLSGTVWAVSEEEATGSGTLNRLTTPYASGETDFFVHPNPLKSGTPFSSVTMVGVPDGSRIEIFDVSGQTVRELPPSVEPYVWDTLDSESLEVPSGVYVVRLETPEGRVAFTKVAIVR